MATLKVRCIRRDGEDLDRRIDGIGGDGFYHVIENAIWNIQSNVHLYYTMVDGEVALLEVGKHPLTGRLFLQTAGDDYPDNNLLHLPECPAGG